MAWNPEKDRLRKPNNDPEKKPEWPPKQRKVSEKTARRLGRTALKGSR